MFITFEGIDGCGKTTQVDLLAETLRELRYDVVVVREPGSTPVGEAIRGILTNCQALTIRTEVLLFNAARAQLVATVIRPALAEGKIVLCDRFYDSTLAYQAYGRGYHTEPIEKINNYAVDLLHPDLTVWFDISIEAAADRIKARDSVDVDCKFLKRVSRGYRVLQGRHWERVGGHGEVLTVHQRVIEAVYPRIVKEMGKP